MQCNAIFVVTKGWMLLDIGWSVLFLFNHTSLVAVVTPTDHPKSVRNRCIIDVFGGVFVLSLCFFELSLGVIKKRLLLSLYTILNRIWLTIWTIFAFRLLNPHQWSSAKHGSLKVEKYPKKAEAKTVVINLQNYNFNYYKHGKFWCSQIKKKDFY